MKKAIQVTPVPSLSVSLPAATPRLVYTAPKLNVIGDIAKISKVSLAKAFSNFS